MPLETPPSRVKKEWRRPGTADSSDEVRGHQLPPAFSRSLRPARPASRGSEMPSTLNIEPMPPRPVSVSRFSATEMSVATSGVAFCISAAARVSMPTRLRKSPCVTGPCTRAPTSSAARQRLEVDISGDVGPARRFQGIGEGVACDGLKGVAGIAAQMAVIDDQRRAILVAHARGELHDLGIGPPFEHRADGSCTHQGRQQHVEARRRVGGRAELELAIGVDLDHTLAPAVLALHHLVDWQHVEIFVGEDDGGSLRHVVDAVVPGDLLRTPDNVAPCRSRRTGLTSTR